MLQKFKQSTFAKKISKVLGGTFAAQLITVGTTFFLARVYDVESFGSFELVVSTSMIIGTIVSIRYEMAIMLPKFDKLAFNIYALSLKLAIFISFLIGVLILVASTLFKLPFSAELLFLSLAGGMGVCFLNVSTMWYNRVEKFGIAALYKVCRAAFVFFVQWLLLESAFNGLAYGYSIGFCSVGLVSVSTPFFLKANRLNVSRKLQHLVFRKYLKFSLWALPGALTNSIASAVPIYLIGSIYSSKEVGLFGMLRRLLYGPITLISGSVNQVIFQEFTKMIAHKKNIVKKYIRVAKNMTVASLVVVLVACVAVYFDVFSILLGTEWDALDSLFYFMIPTLLFGFIAKSVSRFAIFGRTDIGFAFQMVLLIATLLAFWVAWLTGLSFGHTILLYSITQALIFSLQLLLTYSLAKKT